MTSNAWWAAQCPETYYTADSLKKSKLGGRANCVKPTDTCPAILLMTGGTNPITGWTLAECKRASPIYEWTRLSTSLIVSNGIHFFLWIISIASFSHFLFYRSYQASAIPSFLNLVFAIMAITSYGSKAQVWSSWIGITLGSQSIFKSDT